MLSHQCNMWNFYNVFHFDHKSGMAQMDKLKRELGLGFFDRHLSDCVIGYCTSVTTDVSCGLLSGTAVSWAQFLTEWGKRKYMRLNTDYGRIMAGSQILYSQFHTWDIFGLGLKSKVFCRTNNWIIKIMDRVPKLLVIVRKYPRIYSANVPNWPKSLEYHWKKASFVVRT